MKWKILYCSSPKSQILQIQSEVRMSPQELTPEELNAQMVSLLQINKKAHASQEHLIRQLMAYLAKVQETAKSELQQGEKLIRDLQKAQQELEQENREFEQQMRRVDLAERERDQEMERKNQVLATTAAKLEQMAYREEIIGKELAFRDREIEEIVSHTRILENKLDAVNEQNKKQQLEILRINNEKKLLDQYIEECYMNKKKLNNELQQLRGNIRVYCRIKPFLTLDHGEPMYELINENTLKLKVPKENHKSQNHQKDYTFNFEQIFDMKENQESIFNELVQLIQSAVDGKNVCIFAYGQTGSGKTYTMQGGASKESMGIIPRSVQFIFDQAKKAEKYQWSSEISITIQEVYLETARDLLFPNNPKGPEQISSKVTRSPFEVYSYLDQATKNRKVAETNCNEHSSRSHLIFTLHILSRNEEKGLERMGSLNLVDLAGSERVSMSKVEGDRMKETQAINKSLTNLGIVISALAKKQQHIPFRNSKLTYLLQKYLEGDSKTLMFVNISPEQSDYNQTICSLRFAEKVKECKLRNKSRDILQKDR